MFVVSYLARTPCIHCYSDVIAFDSKADDGRHSICGYRKDPTVLHLDDINRELLDVLQVDGRMTYKQLGERIGLTAPAVAERVRKLEDLGIISGYTATVDYEKIGFPIQCVVRLKARSGTAGVDDKLRTIPNIVEANRVTGSDSHVMRAHIRTAHELEELLTDVWDDGETITNIITSSPVPRRPMNLLATNAGREID